MIEAIETIGQHLPEITAIAILGMALTRKQRLAILERDDYQSQLLHYNEEDGFHRGGYCVDKGEGCEQLHVHHIVPERVAKKMGWTREERDDPRNLITLYKCEHVGICDERKIK